MIEFTWTGTVAESHLWSRELQRFAACATLVGDLLALRDELEPRPVPTGVFPAGTTDLDLLDEVLRARPSSAPVADVLLEPRAEIRELCSQLEFTEAGRVVDWDRDQPVVALPAHVVREGRLVGTIGFTADVLDTRQHEWDVLRQGWLSRLADRGWQPHPVEMGWRFASRADLEAVVAIELAPEYADGLLSEVSGTEVDYAVTVWSRRF